MKLLLYCDEYCYKYNDHYYLEDFGIILLNRYLSVFENVKYPVRVKNVHKKEDLGKFNKPIDESRVEVVPIPFGQGVIDFLKNYRKIQKALYNICDTCQFAFLRLPSVYSFNILRYVWKERLPYATEIVFDCYDGFKSSTSFTEKMAYLLMHNLQIKACSKAEGISCVTAEYLQQRYYPKKKDTIVSNYSSIELPYSFYFKRRNYPEKKIFRIIHVAYQVAFNSRKGHNQLLEALKRVRDAGINAEIVFVGGDYANGIEQLRIYAKDLNIKEHVSFTGFLSRPELREQMMEADLAVMPTKAEGLPRVVIEAMAMGLPCISTNVSGNPELLDKEFLLDYTDVNGFAKCIKAVLSDQLLYESTSRTNYERSLEYEAKILQTKREKFYKQLRDKIENK